jgi:alkylation response protein AidB-like acyl-CoA dehydrogenase
MNAGADLVHQTPPADRARRIGAIIAAEAPAIETAQALTAPVLDALHGERLFRCLIPRRFGGEEATPAEHVRMIIELARHDASTAWCVNQASGCSMAAAYLPEGSAARIWGADPRAVLAWGAGPVGVATAVDGGYVVNGRWQFCSGGKHSTWIGGHCRVLEPDRSFRLDGDGQLLERSMLFERSAARFTSGWDVIGLRGTGSDSYEVTDLFVPEAFSLCRDTDAERQEDGPLYQFTTTHLYAAGFAGVALGVARGMLDAFVALARAKTPRGTDSLLMHSAPVQRELGVAEGTWRAARAGVMAALNEAWDGASLTGRITADQHFGIRLASTFAIHQAKAAADIVWREAGATAIFEDGGFARRLRDIHAVSQQIQGRMSHLETVGQHLLGLEAAVG